MAILIKEDNLEFKKIGMAVGISLIAFMLVSMSFNVVHSSLIAVIVLLVALWTNEGLPLGIVSLLPILLFPTFDILSTNATTVNYSKSIIFLFLGGFMLAIATQKINLHTIIANKILSIFPNTVRGIMFSLSITSAVLSSIISNTTTSLLLIPIAMYLTDEVKLKMRFVLSIAYGASIGGIITPIGTPPNLILLGFLEQHNLQPLSFVGWMGLTIPLAMIMLTIMPFILSYGMNHIELKGNINQDTTINSEQKRLTYILLGLIMLLLINSPIKPFYNGLGLNEKGILLGFGILMFMPKIGFLTWEDTKKIPYEIIFLFGAGFSIAAAFSHTGLAKEIANSLLTLTTLSPFLLIIIVATLITFTTEVTSNTALISIALPIIFSLGEASNINVNLILMVATICASYAFMLPIATPPNAIAVSSGAVKIADMAKIGFLFNILGIISIVVIATVMWSNFF
jgi:sodium-dependent dicarboxylate transporter 2/3/5